jgi:hypothetical protein
LKAYGAGKNLYGGTGEGGRGKGLIRKNILSCGKALAKDKRGNSTPAVIALILGLLFLVCAISEFFRLMIIAQGVRDGLQQAVISVATTNYDEAYRGLREGYSGGYRLYGDQWVEDLDYGDVYYHLDSLLGTRRDGSCHVKVQDGGYEYRLSGLRVEIDNTGLAPGSASRNLEADARITIEIPMSFGWGMVPPLVMELRTKAAYMPKF